MPVAVENIGLVVNTKLAKVPKTWAGLEKAALAFKRKGSGRLAIAVQNAPSGDTYHHQPFLTGLCGYIFGRTKGGALNPNDIGLTNPRFLKNAPLIDKWNKEGLINGKVDGTTAQNAFLQGKAAFWVTGPWNIDALNKAGIKYAVVQIPKIKCRAAPFLGAQGFYVTRYAAQHGVSTAAKDLVSNYMATAAAQTSFYGVNGRYPANSVAGKAVKNKALAQFGRAGVGAEPMPNIPQMSAVWDDTNAAWVKTLKGAGATKARTAFTVAARNIRAKIG
jgi:arabinogalactan oligomer/maltooligosaccharide transport system substrate-binding protein